MASSNLRELHSTTQHHEMGPPPRPSQSIPGLKTAWEKSEISDIPVDYVTPDGRLHFDFLPFGGLGHHSVDLRPRDPTTSNALGVVTPEGASIFISHFNAALGLSGARATGKFLPCVKGLLKLDLVFPTNYQAPYDYDGESMETFRERFRTDTIPQMMYVSGETGEPSVETTGIIEEIVRQQVIEIVSANYTMIHCESNNTTATKLHRTRFSSRRSRYHD